MIVVDTNVMVYLLSGDGAGADLAGKLLLRDPEWASPPILLSELRNVLVGSVRKDLLEPADALAMHDDAMMILGDRVARVDGSAVMKAALDMELSAYDAEFVVLARQLGVPLVTEDARILAAAPDVSVALGAPGDE